MLTALRLCGVAGRLWDTAPPRRRDVKVKGEQMAKMKTHKGTKKRIKLTATGKAMRRRAFASHLLTKKSANRKRKMRKPAVVDATDTARICGLLGR